MLCVSNQTFKDYQASCGRSNEGPKVNPEPSLYQSVVSPDMANLTDSRQRTQQWPLYASGRGQREALIQPSSPVPRANSLDSTHWYLSAFPLGHEMIMI